MNPKQFEHLKDIMRALPTEYLECWARGTHAWRKLKTRPAGYGYERLEVCDFCVSRRRSDLDRYFYPTKRYAIEYAQPDLYCIRKHEDVDLTGIGVWELRRAADAVLYERELKEAA